MAQTTQNYLIYKILEAKMGKFIDNKNVRITLVNPENWECYDLYYRLYNTKLSAKWCQLLEDMKFGEKSFRDKRIKFTRTLLTKDMAFEERLTNIIRKINLFYDKPLTIFKKYDQAAIDYLYKQFDEYQGRVAEKLSKKWWDTAYQRIPADSPEALQWPGITFNEDFHTTFNQLNDAITIAETLAASASDEKPTIETTSSTEANLLISFNPRRDFEITNEDAASFMSHLRFGDLVLGYNGEGKNLSRVVADGDGVAVDNNSITRQESWSNEILCYLIHDSYDPYTLTNDWKKFKELDEDKHLDYQWRNPDNRDGFMGIGRLVDVQLEKIYSPVTGITINLNKFRSIQDVEIVDDIQMYSSIENPRARIPQWKFPIPVQGKKIVGVKNEQRVIVTWILNDICNYSCRYCPSSLHNGKNHLFNWEQIEPFLDKMFEHWDGKYINFSLSGGEPTMSPFFPQMVQKIHSLGGNVGITTNLARTPRFIKENFKYLTYAACSFHPAQEFANGTAKDYLDRIRIATMQTMVSLRIMMDPLYWEETLEFIDQAKKTTTARIELVYIDDQYGSSRTKLAKINYSEEQNQFFKNFKQVETRSSPDNISVTNPIYRPFPPWSPTATFSDGSRAIIDNEQELINRGQTNFYDFNCNIGVESLFIHQNGHIKRGNCDVGGVIGTVKDFDQLNWNTLSNPVICNSLRCHCGADISISKWKRV